ncbi:MAG TPA: hypothetical protein VME42_08670 [Steroidobacteraceae bacterium]|nr:hypothetical protein [Steroidobacteraceae bacterium]
MSETPALQTLIDRQTITDLILRYCRALDRRIDGDLDAQQPA